MSTLEDICDIIFDTYMSELDKISNIIIPAVEDMLLLRKINGTPLKSLSVNKKKFVALNMSYMSMFYVINTGGVY